MLSYYIVLSEGLGKTLGVAEVSTNNVATATQRRVSTFRLGH
jgi:hypothetical protein